MKVTEEMIVTASQRYADRAGRVIASGDVRAMLEAALADVPELTANECAACIAALIAIETPDTEESVARLVEKLTKMAHLNPRVEQEVAP
jgi:hypothetical protein